MTELSKARRAAPVSSIGIVTTISILALAFSAYRVYAVIADMVDRLAHRVTGISLTWNPSFPAPQPANAHFGGSAFVSPGTTAYFTAMTGTVKNAPVDAIVLQSVSDLVSVLTTAGIGLCILFLTRRIAAGTPFTRASIRTLIALAVIVLVGFEGVTVLHALSVVHMDSVLFAKPEQPGGTFVVPGTETALLTFWPIYVSAALGALAAVFRAGARLQDDTAGLV